MKKWIALASGLVLGLSTGHAFAEQNVVRIARGLALGHLPMLVMQHEKLLEKHAAALGIKDLKVDWDTHATTAVGGDALLSGNLDILSTGGIQGIVFWSKTKGTPNEIKPIAAEAALPSVLATKSPDIKSLKDIKPTDRIALVAVQVSNTAILLQMAAAKEFGQENFAKLDPLTVTRAPPDAVAALLSNTEITLDFSTPPYSQMELSKPGVHEILNSSDILGDQPTFSVPITSKKFYDNNPTLMKAFYESLQEADDIITNDKPRTLEAYRALGDGFPDEIFMKAVNDPKTKFSVTPKGTLAISQWMQKTGLIQAAPSDWKELFFPIAQNLNGS